MNRLPLTGQIEYKEILGDNWEGDNYIFIEWNDRFMDLSTPKHKFNFILKYYNFSVADEKDRLSDIHFHSLSHTSAVFSIASDLAVRTVSARLGHANPTTTMNIYAHSFKTMDEVTSEALDKILKSQ